MKLLTLIIAFVGATVSSAISPPDQTRDLAARDDASSFFSTPAESLNELFKRKGGGGRGGGGSFGGSSSGGSRTGGSSGGGGTSGVRPSYGGGRYYGGGSTSAYQAGARSPRGVSPVLLAAPLLLFPGIWLYGAYRYHNRDSYTFYNATANPPQNQTKPVDCLCSQYQECGCDATDDDDYLDSIIGNGSYAALNKTLVNVANDNGRSTIFLNGTLPNGTAESTEGAAGPQVRLGWAGYWVMAAAVLFAVLGL